MLKIEDILYEVGKKKILKGVNLAVKKGELVVITGPNGSGKSTLAEIMIGLRTPNTGKIFFNGQDITSVDITERAKRGMSFAFQRPVKIKGITVRKLLEIASGKSEILNYLEKVGLKPGEYLEREINSELSGGELKRIEIASVLARESELMIFDEPEAGIDLWSFKNLIEVFKKLQKAGRTMIIISHQERILKIADRIIILEDGKIKKEGSSKEILAVLAKGEYGN